MVGTRSNIAVAYFAICSTADEAGRIGGILVTDETGIPKEFRCTHPVKPTAAQKALYGGILEPHIAFELCGKPLLAAVTSSPIACIVESRQMMKLREYVNLPVLYVERLGEVLTVGADSEGTSSSAGLGRLDSAIWRVRAVGRSYVPWV